MVVDSVLRRQLPCVAFGQDCNGFFAVVSTQFKSLIIERLKVRREQQGMSAEQLDLRLRVANGWCLAFEEGVAFPNLSLLLAMSNELGMSYGQLFEGAPLVSPQEVERNLYFSEIDGGFRIHFNYSRHDAIYDLSGGTITEANGVVNCLRNGLSASHGRNQDRETVKLTAVADSFLLAMQLWPNANPSDIWWFLIYRAYCDALNHPPRDARLDHAQSWKRTSGWALEKIVVDHYSDFLRQHGIVISLASSEKKREIVNSLPIADRLEADKIDVVLEGDTPEGLRFFGVVHVKASFAERRTDDIHMSQLLKTAGYTTPLWTMDCKSSPSSEPVNRGELGSASGNRSAKRKDIEDEGYFTRCFSYNSNTQPSPNTLPADKRIYLADFQDPDDQFSNFIIQRWQNYYAL